jgi:ribonucleoside-diphosphate reductase alpha chain
MGTAFVSINESPAGDIFEVFIHLGRAGSDLMADAEAIGRLISLAFRIPSDYSPSRIAQNVIDQLAGIGGSSSTGFGAQRVRSLADAVARAISDHEVNKKALLEGEVVEDLKALRAMGVQMGINVPAVAGDETEHKEARKGTIDICPECGSASLRHVEGCQKCESCGFSKC